MDNYGILTEEHKHYGNAKYVIFRDPKTGELHMDIAHGSTRLPYLKDVRVRVGKQEYVAAHENVDALVLAETQKRMAELNRGRKTFVLGPGGSQMEVFRRYMVLEKILNRIE